MSDESREDWVELVCRFWFDELQPEQWFRSDPAVDAVIRRRFADLHKALTAAPVVISDPRAALARIIVLDQFSRNMFRGSPEAFAVDPLALEISEAAIAAGFDHGLAPRERQFLYMPLQHSEDRAVQRRSVKLFAGLGMPEALGFAERHKAIIDRFGRFPHRNAVLRRPSTSEEIEFLKAAPSFG